MDIFPTPQESKLGWFNASNHYRRLQKNKGSSMIIIGRFVAAGLRRYFSVCILRRLSLLFLAAAKMINTAISRDRLEYILRHAGNIDWPNSTQIVNVILVTSTLKNQV